MSPIVDFNMDNVVPPTNAPDGPYLLRCIQAERKLSNRKTREVIHLVFAFVNRPATSPVHQTLSIPTDVELAEADASTEETKADWMKMEIKTTCQSFGLDPTTSEPEEFLGREQEAVVGTEAGTGSYRDRNKVLRWNDSPRS